MGIDNLAKFVGVKFREKISKYLFFGCELVGMVGLGVSLFQLLGIIPVTYYLTSESINWRYEIMSLLSMIGAVSLYQYGKGHREKVE